MFDIWSNYTLVTKYWPALGDGPAPGATGAADDGVQAVQVLIQLVARVTVEGEDSSLDQEVWRAPSNVAILDTEDNLMSENNSHYTLFRFYW